MIPFISRIPAEDRRVYSVDSISACYYGIFLGFVAPFVPVLLKRLGATPFQLGLALSSPFLALLVSFPLFRFFRSCKAIDLVTVPTLFSRLSVVLIGYFTDSWPILLVFVFVQFIEGFGLPAYTRVLKEIYSDAGRSLAVGYVRTLLGMCQILAAGLGGYMMDHGHGLLLFALAGICGAISSLSFRRVFPVIADSPVFFSREMSFRDVIRTNKESERFFWLNVTVCVFGFGNLLVLGVLPTILVERFDISNARLGNLNSLTSLIQIVCLCGLGKFLSRHGAQRGMFIGLLAGVSLPWLFLFAPSSGFLAVPYALTGILFATFDLCWILLVISYAPIEEIGIYSSVYTLILGGRGVLAMFFANLGLPYLGADFFLFLAGCFTLTGLTLGYVNRRKWRAI
jgi:MFS family permease